MRIVIAAALAGSLACAGSTGPQGEPGTPGAPGSSLAQHAGTKVSTGLYEVHSRVLWDVSWYQPQGTETHGFFTYTDTPRMLTYSNGRTLILSPLKGYGVPEPQQDALRRVRLYVNYGHQMDCGGTPTVRIGSVDFSLPVIGGAFGDVAANWSDFKDYADYSTLGHAPISVYLKNFQRRAGGDCGYSGSIMGAVYRIEAHFYDQFAE